MTRSLSALTPSQRRAMWRLGQARSAFQDEECSGALTSSASDDPAVHSARGHRCTGGCWPAFIHWKTATARERFWMVEVDHYYGEFPMLRLTEAGMSWLCENPSPRGSRA